ncbi:hypothetical protein FNV43_RR16740 [Rhamnella rubrinervis]|uniref:Uncharacterized protein n=1 Tax=Rhamnella rubrinervis TaxID=2594499 RepID=A0A8K0MDL5_9ROSA|nr:hypothetical protein FNV43_RR16740 [Rhamnella rubrinervis]
MAVYQQRVAKYYNAKVGLGSSSGDYIITKCSTIHEEMSARKLRPVGRPLGCGRTEAGAYKLQSLDGMGVPRSWARLTCAAITIKGRGDPILICRRAYDHVVGVLKDGVDGAFLYIYFWLGAMSHLSYGSVPLPADLVVSRGLRLHYPSDRLLASDPSFPTFGRLWPPAVCLGEVVFLSALLAAAALMGLERLGLLGGRVAGGMAIGKVFGFAAAFKEEDTLGNFLDGWVEGSSSSGYAFGFFITNKFLLRPGDLVRAERILRKVWMKALGFSHEEGRIRSFVGGDHGLSARLSLKCNVDSICIVIWKSFSEGISILIIGSHGYRSGPIAAGPSTTMLGVGWGSYVRLEDWNRHEARSGRSIAGRGEVGETKAGQDLMQRKLRESEKLWRSVASSCAFESGLRVGKSAIGLEVLVNGSVWGRRLSRGCGSFEKKVRMKAEELSDAPRGHNVMVSEAAVECRRAFDFPYVAKSIENVLIAERSVGNTHESLWLGGRWYRKNSRKR